MGKLGTFVARLSSLASQIGKDIKSLRENKIPFTGADKEVDLNTQSLTHEGNFIKREGQFEQKMLKNSNSQAEFFIKLTDVASLSRPLNAETEGDIIIYLPIINFTLWQAEIDITGIHSTSKIHISAYGISNIYPRVFTGYSNDIIQSVKFARRGGSTVIVIKMTDKTFASGRVNLSKLYASVNHTNSLFVKSNYKIEFLKEEDIEGLVINRTILNKDFKRDPYLLDFNNFTNVPNFAQASNVYTKSEALDRFIPRVGDADVDGTKRFLQAPIVPKGTLDSHAVNKGQVDGMLGGYIPRDSDVGIPVESLLAFMKPIIVPEATVNEHAVNKGQVIEMQGIVMDDKGNFLAKYVLDNPDKYNISGRGNFILVNNTVPDTLVTALAHDSFLYGSDHAVLASYSLVTGLGNHVRGNGSSAVGMFNDIAGKSAFAANYKNMTEHPYESAFGCYNKAYSRNKGDDIPDDLRFSIGIGDGEETRMNAVSVFKNGETWFDELTPDKIDNSISDRVAITKEYLNLRVPKPPTFGNHVLKSIGGAVQWVAE